MIEDEIKIFIAEIENYFNKLSDTPAVINAPFPRGKELQIYDYTGLIGISGARRGCLYISTTAELLMSVAGLILNKQELPEEILLDIAGELANTIAGSAQAAASSAFDISVPLLFKGQFDDVKFNGEFPTYAVPFSWREKKGIMVIGLE